MDKLIDINEYPVKDTLKILLQDKSTKKNIIWATDIYNEYGPGFNDKNQIKLSLFNGTNAFKLRPRISKTLEEQQERTRKKAEVILIVLAPVTKCQ